MVVDVILLPVLVPLRFQCRTKLHHESSGVSAFLAPPVQQQPGAHTTPCVVEASASNENRPVNELLAVSRSLARYRLQALVETAQLCRPALCAMLAVRGSVDIKV